MLTNTSAFWRTISGRLFPGNDYLFQDDNTPVHRARSTKEYVARTHLKNMSWTAQSPDSKKVIENIWLYIKRKLEIRIHKINSNSDLFREIFRIWQTIPLTYNTIEIFMIQFQGEFLMLLD
jgi:hypothetical protein